MSLAGVSVGTAAEEGGLDADTVPLLLSAAGVCALTPDAGLLEEEEVSVSELTGARLWDAAVAEGAAVSVSMLLSAEPLVALDGGVGPAGCECAAPLLLLVALAAIGAALEARDGAATPSLCTRDISESKCANFVDCA